MLDKAMSALKDKRKRAAVITQGLPLTLKLISNHRETITLLYKLAVTLAAEVQPPQLCVMKRSVPQRLCWFETPAFYAVHPDAHWQGLGEWQNDIEMKPLRAFGFAFKHDNEFVCVASNGQYLKTTIDIKVAIQAVYNYEYGVRSK